MGKGPSKASAVRKSMRVKARNRKYRDAQGKVLPKASEVKTYRIGDPEDEAFRGAP